MVLVEVTYHTREGEIKKKMDITKELIKQREKLNKGNPKPYITIKVI